MQARASVMTLHPALLEALRQPDITARGERPDNAIRSQSRQVG
ncbi:hypothetical protein ACQ856_05060 [Mycolicibacterium psychrotolerans]